MPRGGDGGRGPIRALLGEPAFLRLWSAGGLTNAMRWVEALASGLFTFDVTGSAFAVSMVLMSRAIPMLAAGAIAGAVAESLDRRRLLMAGQAAAALGAAAIALLAATGHLALWHLFLSSLLGGLVWTNEHATRRRMVAEVAGPDRVVQAVAFDTMTGSTTRMVGPLLGGVLYQTLGIAAAFAISALFYALALLLVAGVRHAQTLRPLRPQRLATEIGEAVRIALAHPSLRMVLGVTVVMNVFGFSYAGILPAFGAVAFHATPAEIGILAAAEPLGALLAGLGFALRRGPPPGRSALALGCGGFLVVLIFAAMAPGLLLAALLLMLGGLGTAAFAILQTGLVISEAPIEARSRILGLTTTCIGTGPLGVIVVGALADLIGPRLAVAGMGAVGLVLLALAVRVALRPRRAA